MYCICPFNTSQSIIKQAIASGLIYISVVFYCVYIKRSALCYKSSLENQVGYIGTSPTLYFCTLAACRPVVGACLLRASEGACVRRLKAWLFLPDANLLPERGGTKPGESFSISTHAQPRVSRHTDSKTLATCGFFLLLLFLSQVINWQNWKLQTSVG